MLNMENGYVAREAKANPPNETELLLSYQLHAQLSPISSELSQVAADFAKQVFSHGAHEQQRY